MKNRRKRNAFSLLELLAVVAILGIIAAIVVPRVTVSTAAAGTAVDAHTQGQINAAIERYYIDNSNTWPTALSDLVPNYFPDGVPTKSGGGAWTYDNSGMSPTYRVS